MTRTRAMTGAPMTAHAALPRAPRTLLWATLATASVVLVGWSLPGAAARGLTSWGAQGTTTPWTVLMCAGLAAAVLTPAHVARRVCLVVAGMATVSLVRPDAVVRMQEAIWPVAMSGPPPGIDIAVLLLVGGVWVCRSDSAPDGLAGALGSGAGAVAILALLGRVIGAGWLSDAGARDIEAGISLPSTMMLLLLTIALWQVDASRARRGEVLARSRRRQRLVGILAAIALPVVAVWLLPTPADPTGTDYATLALVVIAVTLGLQLMFMASYHGEALTTVETMLDASPEPTLFLDGDGTILRLNRAVTKAYGWPREELLGRPIDVLVPATGPWVTTLARQVDARPLPAPPSPSPERVIAVHHGGVIVPAELSLSPVKLRGRALVAATVRDETAHEQQVEMLRSLHEMQSTFMTAVSHELRTPLTVVMGLADTLMRHESDLSLEERHGLLERLRANARRLDVLLSDLLDVDRLRRGVALAGTQVDMGALVRRQSRRSARELRLDVALDVDSQLPAVRTDPVLLQRVVDNLLANAAKYAGGPVEVRVKPDDGGVVLMVEDHGPGVPPPMRDQVFEPFRRGERLDSATPGVGIGLSLVAGVAGAARGRAWVQGRADGTPGASFRVRLPAATEDQPFDGSTITLDDAGLPATTRQR
jgi:PAS domain S-box-containing protein